MKKWGEKKKEKRRKGEGGRGREEGGGVAERVKDQNRKMLRGNCGLLVARR